MAYTIWSQLYGSREWIFGGLQSESEKVAEQAFLMYRLAPGETLQLRDPDGTVIDVRTDMSRPHDTVP